MERPTRKHLPRTDLLLSQCDDAIVGLKSILKYDVTRIHDDPDTLRSYIDDLKFSFKSFSSICHDAICSLFKYGSVAQGRNLQDIKASMKQETNENISLALSLLGGLGVSDDISMVDSVDSSFCGHNSCSGSG